MADQQLREALEREAKWLRSAAGTYERSGNALFVWPSTALRLADLLDRAALAAPVEDEGQDYAKGIEAVLVDVFRAFGVTSDTITLEGLAAEVDMVYGYREANRRPVATEGQEDGRRWTLEAIDEERGPVKLNAVVWWKVERGPCPACGGDGRERYGDWGRCHVCSTDA